MILILRGFDTQRTYRDAFDSGETMAAATLLLDVTAVEYTKELIRDFTEPQNGWAYVFGPFAKRPDSTEFEWLEELQLTYTRRGSDVREELVGYDCQLLERVNGNEQRLLIARVGPKKEIAE